jgi:hypothetical protein
MTPDVPTDFSITGNVHLTPPSANSLVRSAVDNWSVPD